MLQSSLKIVNLRLSNRIVVSLIQSVNMVKVICFILLIVALPKTQLAQDIHFSQVNRQPLFQNPANTGLFKGDIRLTANHKDQWRSVSVPFKTSVFAIDAKTKLNGLSIGCLLFHDQVGDGALQTVEALLSAAKHVRLTADGRQKLSFGLQLGLNYRQLNWNKFYFDNQFNGLYFDPTIPITETIANTSTRNSTVGTGIVYTNELDTKNKFTIGLSGHNLNRPNQGFFGTTIKRDARLSLYGTYEYLFSTQFHFIPGFSFNAQGKYKELLIGSQVKYILTDRKGLYQAVDGGIWMRTKDAFVVRLGAAIQNWSVGLSYDINISKLAVASNFRGGLELSACYIISRFKPKKSTYKVCPDFL
jgi:type IX secretion system PorP/SprF family membrane protein